MHNAYGYLLAESSRAEPGRASCGLFLALTPTLVLALERLTRHVHVTMSGKLPAVSYVCPRVRLSVRTEAHK